MTRLSGEHVMQREDLYMDISQNLSFLNYGRPYAMKVRARSATAAGGVQRGVPSTSDENVDLW